MTWLEPQLPTDEHLSPDGRVIEVLSEHLCEGWLDGYTLGGRHGLFSCYEAFMHIVVHGRAARQVARHQPGDSVAPLRVVAEHPVHVARVAAGSQRLFAPGHGVHRPDDEPRVLVRV